MPSGKNCVGGRRLDLFRPIALNVPTIATASSTSTPRLTLNVKEWRKGLVELSHLAVWSSMAELVSS